MISRITSGVYHMFDFKSITTSMSFLFIPRMLYESELKVLNIYSCEVLLKSGNLSQWTFSESLKPCSRPHLAQPNKSFVFISPSLVLTSPFVSFAELDYRNSYEIEYMEKIGSSLPVSSSASSQQGTCFPPCFGVSLVTRGWSGGRG